MPYGKGKGGQSSSEQAIFPYRFASSVPLAAKERSTGSERNQHLNSVVACGGQRTPPFLATTLEHSSVCCRYEKPLLTSFLVFLIDVLTRSEVRSS